MKTLQNIADRRQVYLIEGVRISYLIAESNYNILTRSLKKFENSDVDSAILIYSSAWMLVDSLHRYGDCIKDIRGLSHNDSRYSNFSKQHNDINYFRNYMQHLSGGKTFKKLASNNDLYPAMGALAWSFDGSISKTISYATLPSGTSFNTLPYSMEHKKYQIDIKIGCLDAELSLMQSIEKLKAIHAYFSEFLVSKDYISTEELEISHAEIGPIFKKCISDEGVDVSDHYQDVIKESSKKEFIRGQFRIS